MRVRADFTTISSRIDSLQEWPHTILHPCEVAVAGFYHDPTGEDPATVTCFSCEVVWPRTKPSGLYSKNEVQIILLDYHLDNCLWADLLRNAMDLIQLPENTRKMEDRNKQLESGIQRDTAYNDRSSVNFSVRIDRPRKGDPKEQLRILEAMSMLLSQNTVFSFTCNN